MKNGHKFFEHQTFTLNLAMFVPVLRNIWEKNFKHALLDQHQFVYCPGLALLLNNKFPPW